MHCIGCGRPNDGALEMQDGGRPEPEDAAICISCGTISIYTEVMGKLAFRHPTEEELKELLAQENVRKAIWATGEARKLSDE
jgi:hypothetical protein